METRREMDSGRKWNPPIKTHANEFLTRREQCSGPGRAAEGSRAYDVGTESERGNLGSPVLISEPLLQQPCGLLLTCARQKHLPPDGSSKCG